MSDYADQMNYHNRKDGNDAATTFQRVNFVDALGETSVRTRRALLALSVVAVVLAKYTVSVKQIPWLEIPAPVDAESLVPMLLAAAIAYHWVSFSLYGIGDAIKWERTRDSAVFSSRAQLIFRLNEHVRRFEDMALRIAPETNIAQWIALQQPVVSDAQEVSRCAIEEWNAFYGLSRFEFWLKRLTIWIWEIVLPLTFGTFATIWLYRARLR